MLRQERRRRLKAYPAERRKDARKAAKPESDNQTLIKTAGIRLLFSIILPAVILGLVQEWFDLGVFTEVLPLFLFPMACFCTSVCFSRLREGPEYFLLLLLPFPVQEVVRAGFSRMFRSLLFGCWLVFLLTGLAGLMSNDSAPLLGLALMHSMAFAVTVMFLLKIQRPGWMQGLCVGALVLGLGRLCLPPKFAVSKSVTEAALLVFPNGWVDRAVAEWMAGRPLPALIWTGLLVPVLMFAVSWISEEKRRMTQTCIRKEWEEHDAGFEDEFFDEDLYGALPVEAAPKAFPGELVPQWLYDYLFLLHGGEPLRPYPGKFLTGMSLFGLVLSLLIPYFVSTPLYFITYALMVIPALAMTPLLGGGWKNVPEGIVHPQILPVMGVYPVPLSVVYGTAIKVNGFACMVAFPFWLVVGIGIGLSALTVFKGLQLALGIWFMVLMGQPFGLLACLTQTGVVVARGKVWRALLSLLAVLIWLGFLLAALVFLILSMGKPACLGYWAALAVGGVGCYGWILSVILIRAYEGNAYDYMTVQKPTR